MLMQVILFLNSQEVPDVSSWPRSISPLSHHIVVSHVLWSTNVTDCLELACFLTTKTEVPEKLAKDKNVPKVNLEPAKPSQ